MNALLTKVRKIWDAKRVRSANNKLSSGTNDDRHIALIQGGYDSQNIGNDAAARPWDQVGEDFVPSTLRSRDHLDVNQKHNDHSPPEFTIPDVPLSHGSGLLSGAKGSSSLATSALPTK